MLEPILKTLWLTGSAALPLLPSLLLCLQPVIPVQAASIATPAHQTPSKQEGLSTAALVHLAILLPWGRQCALIHVSTTGCWQLQSISDHLVQQISSLDRRNPVA